jgi:hypothetical protein
MMLSKEQSRARWRQLQDLIWEWDPIGVASIEDWPKDEYNCLVGPVMRMLERGMTADEIAAVLVADLREHFGLDPDLNETAIFAAKATAWYAEHWAGSTA